MLLLLVSGSLRVLAQHVHQAMPARPDTARQTTDTLPLHDGHSVQADALMSHAFSLHLPMSRNGSGTGWLPDTSPVYGYMLHSKKWMYMLHGSVFLRYNHQDVAGKGTRGGDRFDAPTWFMLMGQRRVGKNGLFHVNTMLSLDPLIEGGRGYPLLFQTGESYKGRPLADRQHPHDFVTGLSVGYAHAFSKNTDVFVYAGYPGEPALGPVTFMHRPSALDNPNSPISHHWVDATHITFGVVTVGVREGRFRLEASSFTGREPDEKRYSFDKPRFDSWSGRLSFNPSASWALQASHGYMKSPEALHPGENVHRTTASAIYSLAMNDENRLNATALWGLNKQRDHKGENAFLLEAALRKNKSAVYTRYEFTEKSGEELVLAPLFDAHERFGVHTWTLGINRDLLEWGNTRIAAGGQWSIYKAPARLDGLYGRFPMAVQVYIRLYPALMRAGSM